MPVTVADTRIREVYDVFLSYSRRDLGVALAMIALLKTAGHRVWWDRDLYAGDNWRETLVLRIAQSRKVVVLWSPNAVASEYVHDEVRQAYPAGKLVPFRIADCDIPERFSDVQAPAIGWTETDDDVTIADADRQLVLDQVGAALKAAPAPIGVAGVKVKLAPALAGSTTFFGRDLERTMLLRAWESGDAHDPAQKTNVVAITAMGGAGKTALIQKFRDDLAAQGYAGATRIYGWSAYSQGSHENKQTSAEPFLVEALADFGHDIRAEPLDTPRLKAERLAALIQRERALVILDGLEPLQHPRVVRAGRFKDDGLDALVTALANHNPGLLVLTSRQHFPELPEASRPRVILHDLAALDEPSSILLLEEKGVVGPRTLPAGPERGINASPRSLADLARTAGHHALTLNLLGGYIAATFGGDLRQIDAVPLAEVLDELAALDDAGGIKAKAMLRFYEARFAGIEAADAAGGGMPELAILSILGLFDRPAEGEAVDMLRAAAIPGLTGGLAALKPRQRAQQWRRGLERLRELQLALPPDDADPGALDAHPLVREHFGERLKATAPETWQAAHERLYEHYRWYGVPEQYRRVDLKQVLEVLQWLPDELPEEKPGETQAAFVERLLGPFRERADAEAAGSPIAMLRQQVAHVPRNVTDDAIRAAAVDVAVGQMRQRITALLAQVSRRVLMALFPPTLGRAAPLLAAVGHGCAAGRQQEVLHDVYHRRLMRGPSAFLNNKLGASGASLAALAHFFASPWTTPAPALRPADRAWLLSEAAFALRALGRLGEAVAPFKVGQEMRIAQADWHNAAADAENLSGLHLVLGDPGRAVAAAREAIAFVERSPTGPEHWQQQVPSWTTLGDALHAAGEQGEATARMLEAERAQGAAQTDAPRLFSLQGYQFADLRLGQGRAREALQRGRLAQQWTTQATEMGQLDHACHHLCLGRAMAALEAGEGRAAARSHLDSAVDRLRKSGQELFIPLGLLARAEFHIQARDLGRAEKDLTEALAIARRGGMRLHETDAMLGFARLSLAAAEERAARAQCLDAARACWQRAVALIAETGYRRRLAEASLIEAEIALGTGDADAALPALEAAAAAISHQQQFGLLALLHRLAAPFPELAPTLDRLAAERAAFDLEADAQWEAHEQMVAEARTRQAAEEAEAAAPDADAVPAAPPAEAPPAAEPAPAPAQSNLARQVATVLADPALRRQTEAMLANPDARAALARSVAAMSSGSLDDLDPEQQVAAMAAFILSRDDDDDEHDEDEDTGASEDDDGDEAAPDAGSGGGRLGAAVEAILGDARGREMVDGLLANGQFRRALVAELEESQVPVPLDELPRDVQRKFAAAFALEKGIIAIKRGDEPEN